MHRNEPRDPTFAQFTILAIKLGSFEPSDTSYSLDIYIRYFFCIATRNYFWMKRFLANFYISFSQHVSSFRILEYSGTWSQLVCKYHNKYNGVPIFFIATVIRVDMRRMLIGKVKFLRVFFIQWSGILCRRIAYSLLTFAFRVVVYVYGRSKRSVVNWEVGLRRKRRKKRTREEEEKRKKE